jgi:hypothetical protein
VPLIGYHDALPVKQGDEIVIPAGTVVRSCNPSKSAYVTKRKQTVKVHHTMPGMSVHPRLYQRAEVVAMCKGREAEVNQHYFDWHFLGLQTEDEEQDPQVRLNLLREYHDYRIPVSNPTVCWPGTGGYWCEVDINDVVAA